MFDEDGLTMGRIDYAGTVRTACLDSVPEVRVGQYVLVHAGFALNVLDEDEARRTLDLFDEIARQNAEEGLDPFGEPLPPEAP
ncbi:MAG TPA: HypC/HybG/HupF family hydrogenase formation chaperone [candidate division Zixibacteria bacterium]|nr:HypC/HybG/HupF family hydrogenase formation chaperone [candidate division Zixibacteria bacterium]